MSNNKPNIKSLNFVRKKFYEIGPWRRRHEHVYDEVGHQELHEAAHCDALETNCPTHFVGVTRVTQ